MKIIFIVSSFLFLVIGVAHSREIIIKDCYTVLGSIQTKGEFDTKKYSQFYFKVDPKNKIINQVSSIADSKFDEIKRILPNAKKNNILNYKLEFIDNNFAEGEEYDSNGKSISIITIDLKKNYVERQMSIGTNYKYTYQCRK